MCSRHGELVLDTVIPHATNFKEAVSLKTPVTLGKRTNAAVKAVKALVDEITARTSSPRTVKEAA